MKRKPKILVIDIDGVMTTGQFLYSEKGKKYKIFGPHDTDGLNLIKKHIKILFVSADKKGFKISTKRIKDDLGYDIKYVHHEKRYDFIKKIGFKNVIYMGDSFHDAKILKDAAYGIAPKNSRIEAKKASNYITRSNSGEGAVLDASLKIKNKYFKK